MVASKHQDPGEFISYVESSKRFTVLWFLPTHLGLGYWNFLQYVGGGETRLRSKVLTAALLAFRQF